MLALLLAIAIVAPLIAAVVFGAYNRGTLSVCASGVSFGTVAFAVFCIGTDGLVRNSDLSTRVADFDTAPVCYRHEPDIVCCGMAGKMTCMIDRRDP